MSICLEIWYAMYVKYIWAWYFLIDLSNFERSMAMFIWRFCLKDFIYITQKNKTLLLNSKIAYHLKVCANHVQGHWNNVKDIENEACNFISSHFLKIEMLMYLYFSPRSFGQYQGCWEKKCVIHLRTKFLEQNAFEDHTFQSHLDTLRVTGVGVGGGGLHYSRPCICKQKYFYEVKRIQSIIDF